jgi:anti-anti-sigma regulatory factor
MLRITKIPRGSSGVALKLEGQIVSEWAGELERECQQLLTKQPNVQLDFDGVTLVDRRGAEMLKGFGNEKLSILNCPPLIRAVLGGGGLDR